MTAPAAGRPSTSQVSPRFLEQIARTLVYWREKASALDDRTILSLDAERRNILRALQFGAAVESLTDECAQLILSCYRLIEQRGYFAEWVPLVERILTGHLAPAQRCGLSIQLGAFYRLTGNLGRATALHQQALALAEATGLPDEAGWAADHLGIDHFQARRYEDAGRFTETARRYYEQAGAFTPARRLGIETQLGLLAQNGGELQEAERHFAEAIELARRDARRDLLVRSLINRGNVLMDLGRHTEVLDVYNEADAMLSGLGNARERAELCLSRAACYYGLGDLDGAYATLSEADSPELRSGGAFTTRAKVLTSLGFVALKQNRLTQAHLALADAVSIWRQLDDEVQSANALGNWGHVYALEDNAADALPLLDEALDILERHPDDAWARILYEEFTAVRSALLQNRAQLAG